jgi:Fe-S-cluster containining protein
MHPCLTCGACCGTFRVSFYRGEALSGSEDGVPEELVEPVGPFRVAMRGTAHEPVRCVALEGAIGTACACAIYARRPSPCREFGASWEEGVHEPRCDAARARYGLGPLTPVDFDAWRADR